MPSWKKHTEYCVKRGIRREICDFVNRLIDQPEEYVPKYLKDPVIKRIVADKLGLSLAEIEEICEHTELVREKKEVCKTCEYRRVCRTEAGKILISLLTSCPLVKDCPHAITHAKVHACEENVAKKVVKVIARYFYGEDGEKAVDLHLELDEIPHILRDLNRMILNYLSRGIKGTVSIFGGMPTVSVVKMLLYKDPQLLVKILKDTGNYETFFQNLIDVLFLEVKELFEIYRRKCRILKNKMIFELIEHLKIAKLLEVIKDDLNEWVKALKELSNLPEDEVRRRLSKDLNDEHISALIKFIHSDDFKKFLTLCQSLNILC